MSVNIYYNTSYLHLSTQKILLKLSDPINSSWILADIWESECTDTLGDGSDERLRPLNLSLVDVLSHPVEPVFVVVFFYEKELELATREHPVARRELEQDRIKGELKSIFPLFHFCIVGSLAIKAIESSTRLVVCDDESIISEPLYSIYFTSELYVR